MYTVRICLEFKLLRVKKDMFNVYIVEIISSLFLYTIFFVLKILESPISVRTHLFIFSYEVLDLNVTNNQS